MKRRKLKRAKVTLAPDLPPPLARKRVNEFIDSLRDDLTGAARRIYVDRRHQEVFGESAPSGVDQDLIEKRVAYELQWLGFKEAGCLDMLSKSANENRLASTLLELDAYPEGLLRDCMVSRRNTKDMRNEIVAKKSKSKKTDGPKKKTTGEFIREYIDRVGLDGADPDKCEALVRKAFPDKNFRGYQLSWYKTEYKQGKLKGQTLKPVKSKSKKSAKKSAPKKKTRKMKRKKKKSAAA